MCWDVSRARGGGDRLSGDRLFGGRAFRWSSFPVVELLDVKADDAAQARAADNLRWLQEEVWPRTAGKSITKDEINELLGFDEMVDE
jgi:hypothetical protein